MTIIKVDKKTTKFICVDKKKPVFSTGSKKEEKEGGK